MKITLTCEIPKATLIEFGTATEQLTKRLLAAGFRKGAGYHWRFNPVKQTNVFTQIVELDETDMEMLARLVKLAMQGDI